MTESRDNNIHPLTKYHPQMAADSKTIHSLEEAISLSQQRCSDIQEENKRSAVSLETTQNKMLEAQRELGGE